jgi:multidrug efflux pump subunit AcrA (membrane-fusion protein)
MATKDADLAGLRINRAPQGAKAPRGSRSSGKIIGWLVALALIVAVAFFFKDFFNPGVEVQLATASLTSPSEVNAVLTASGYVVARRKAAVASKGTGRLVFLGVEEGDKVNKGQVIARLEDADVVAAREHARQNLRLAEADLYREGDDRPG